MSNLFTGTLENKPVTKDRVMLPKQYRNGISKEADKTVLLTIGPANNIVVYPIDVWQRVYNKLAKGSKEQRKLLSDLRLFAMTPQKIEGPGRIKLSNELMKISGIKDKVSFVGEGSFISIWNPERLEKIKLAKLQERMTRIEESDYQEDTDYGVYDVDLP